MGSDTEKIDAKVTEHVKRALASKSDTGDLPLKWKHLRLAIGVVVTLAGGVPTVVWAISSASKQVSAIERNTEERQKAEAQRDDHAKRVSANEKAIEVINTKLETLVTGQTDIKKAIEDMRKEGRRR